MCQVRSGQDKGAVSFVVAWLQPILASVKICMQTSSTDQQLPNAITTDDKKAYN